MKRNCYVFGHKKGPSDRPSWDFKCPDCGAYFDGDNKYRYTFWETDTWDTIKWVLIILVAVLLILSCLIVLILVPGSLMERAACTKYAEMGIKATWNLWTGCMANHPELGWLPIEEYFKTINLYVP